MDAKQIIVFSLAAIGAGGVLYALAYPWLHDTRAEERQKSIYTNPSAAIRANMRETALRRGQVSDSLKELERRQKNLRRPPLTVRIQQAGLQWPVKKFYILSAVLGLVVCILAYILSGSSLIALAALFAGGLGLPRWILRYLTKRRQGKFLKEFPNAIDIITRGVKSGLPLGDCIRIVASEAQEPVKAEFRAVMETQAIGMPLSEAIERMYMRLGLPEVNFFSIVIGIQSKSGGNLSEALGNLAGVLRDRHKMKAKIQAMSAEAKASAGIIGVLPVFVAIMVYFVNPDYISMLWTNTIGMLLLGGSAIWMSLGILTMRKMINFEI